MGSLLNAADLQGWGSLATELSQPYMQELENLLVRRIAAGDTIYPAIPRTTPTDNDILKAFRLTKLANVRVVILGQDPYHQRGVATGLAFALPSPFPKGVRRPPSLTRIYNAVQADLSRTTSGSDNLEHWADGGILLLNTVLTVDQCDAGSHRGLGWECFTNRAIHLVANRKKPVVFMLWGKDAQRKRALIASPPHQILESSHPVYKGFDAGKKRHFSAAERCVGSLPWSIAVVTRPRPSR